MIEDPWVVIGKFIPEWEYQHSRHSDYEQELVNSIRKRGFYQKDIAGAWLELRGPGTKIPSTEKAFDWHSDAHNAEMPLIVWCNIMPTLFRANANRQFIWQAQPGQFVLFRNDLCQHKPPLTIPENRLFFRMGEVRISNPATVQHLGKLWQFGNWSRFEYEGGK